MDVALARETLKNVKEAVKTRSVDDKGLTEINKVLLKSIKRIVENNQ